MCSSSASPVDLTIVITTLGGHELPKTLECIRRSSVSVSSILLCIPVHLSHLVEAFADSTVSIVTTVAQGQVLQRIAGFNLVSTSLVLQIDDDIIFTTDVIKKTYDAALSFGPGFAIGGCIDRNDDFIYKTSITSNKLKFFRRLFLYLLARAPMEDSKRIGKFSNKTWCQLVPPGYNKSAHIPVDLLPGGFCMSWTSELVLYNYYPFPGKAYKEDLLHSLERTKKGIQHIVLPYIILHTDESVSTVFSIKDFLREFSADRWIGIKVGSSPWSFRLHLYIFLEILYGIYRRYRIRRQH